MRTRRAVTDIDDTPTRRWRPSMSSATRQSTLVSADAVAVIRPPLGPCLLLVADSRTGHRTPIRPDIDGERRHRRHVGHAHRLRDVQPVTPAPVAQAAPKQGERASQRRRLCHGVPLSPARVSRQKEGAAAAQMAAHVDSAGAQPVAGLVPQKHWTRQRSLHPLHHWMLVLHAVPAMHDTRHPPAAAHHLRARECPAVVHLAGVRFVARQLDYGRAQLPLGADSTPLVADILLDHRRRLPRMGQHPDAKGADPGPVAGRQGRR